MYDILKLYMCVYARMLRTEIKPTVTVTQSTECFKVEQGSKINLSIILMLTEENTEKPYHRRVRRKMKWKSKNMEKYLNLLEIANCLS